MHQTPCSRRTLLSWLGLGAALPVIAACGGGEARAQSYRIAYTDAEWRRRLTPAQFHVLREAGTERPYTSPLNDERRRGTYHCAGCGNELYRSAQKYDSRTGWPSFWRAADNAAVGYSTDYHLGYPRREVHQRAGTGVPPGLSGWLIAHPPGPQRGRPAKRHRLEPARRAPGDESGHQSSRGRARIELGFDQIGADHDQRGTMTGDDRARFGFGPGEGQDHVAHGGIGAMVPGRDHGVARLFEQHRAP